MLAELPSVAQKNGPATLFVDKQLDKDEIALPLSDSLAVTVQVNGSKALEVKPPSTISTSKGWRLIRASPPAVTEIENAQRRWTQTYVFEPLLPGELALQIEPLEVREGQDPFRKVPWNPLAIRVSTSLGEPDLSKLRDPTVIEPPPLAEQESASWIWASAGALALVLMAVIAIYWRRRARPEPLSPAQRTARQLNRLQAMHLTERGESAGFHRLLANIVRRFLDRKLDLRARRQTTVEFLTTLERSQKLSAAQQACLRDFFQACDLAKFAGANVGTKDEAALLEEIRKFIHDLK